MSGSTRAMGLLKVSYMILQRVSPITHSISNCVKRVVVIVSAVLLFKPTVSPINALGIGIGFAGVFLVSQGELYQGETKSSVTFGYWRLKWHTRDILFEGYKNSRMKWHHLSTRKRKRMF